LHADLARGRLSESLDGSGFSWPPFVVGGESFFGLRFVQRRGGKPTVVDITVVDAYAALGKWDERPASGVTKLKIGPGAQSDGVNTTADIAAGISAADLQTAINAITDVGAGGTYPEASVTLDNGTYEVVFSGHPTEVEITAVENELCPVTLVRVVAIDKDGEWYHTIRFIQAPGAFADNPEVIVPDAPTIERLRGGSEIDGVKVNEIQVLLRPDEFRGNFEIVRGSIPTIPLSRSDDSVTIAEALEPLADEDGVFNVSNPVPGEAWIEFDGEMGGQSQDLMTINVPRAPGGDHWLTLDLSASGMWTLVREKNDVKAPLHIHVLYEDKNDPNTLHRWDYVELVTVRRPVYYEGMEVAANIDFLKPQASTYIPTPVDAIITGNQHVVATFPASGDVGASSFVFTHNLATENGHIAVRRNAGSGKLLVHDTDYEVSFDNANQLTLTLKPGGYFNDPVIPVGDSTKFDTVSEGEIAALGALAFTFTTAGPNSAFQNHTQSITSITDLAATLAAMQAEIDANTAARGAGTISTADVDAPGFGLVWPLPDLFELFPNNGDPQPDAADDFTKIDLEEVFAGTLFPAVHDAASESVLPILVSGELPDDDGSPTYVGRVFENDGSTAIDIPAGGGHRFDTLAPGEFCAFDGTYWYRVENFGAETSYYPTKFNRLLWWLPVSAEQLVSKKILSVDYALKAAMVASETAGHYQFVIEIGTYPEDTTPAPPGPNLQDVVWNVATPALTQKIILGPVAGIHRMGCRVKNTSGAITMDKVIYGAASAAAAAPASANFALRARLVRFDTENSRPAKGVVALSGPAASAAGAAVPDALGTATIT